LGYSLAFSWVEQKALTRDFAKSGDRKGR
jgi:hypothetical protein